MDGAHGGALPPPPPPAGAAPGGAGDGPRRCSQCGHHGHNARTCTARPVKLFGVRIGDTPFRKSASMGNLEQLAEGSGGCGGAGDEGYGSEGDGNKRQKKRGEAWSEEEHKRFLLGLNKLGKGDWRGISRSYVISRTPTQVASHAQKYFIRQTNVHRRKKRSSLFDMVIDDSADQPLSRTSSQEVEEYLEDSQLVTAPEVQPSPGPVPTPVSVPPPVAVMTSPAHVPMITPVLAPPLVPAIAPQQEDKESVATSSNAGEVGSVIPEVMPEFIPPYGYPMMLPPPYYPSAFVPVPYYGYVPFFYGPPSTVQASHEVVKPMATHSKPPVNVVDLYSMSELSLKGDSNTSNDGPKLGLPPNPIGTPGRQSAFHGKGPSDGPSNGLIPAK